MPPNLQVVEIGNGSDGNPAKWPTADKGYRRNDAHWCERMGDRWMKETGAAQPGMMYRLERLPEGFAGFEKFRSNDSKHVDRYVYGHPNGIFRSTNEFWPHLKNLLDVGSSSGCECLLCTGTGRSKRGKTKVLDSDNTRGGITSRHFSRKLSSKLSDVLSTEAIPSRALSYQPPRILEPPNHELNYGIFGLPQGRLPGPPKQQKHAQVDEEGTPDVYRRLIDELKALAPERIDRKVSEHMSPDWRASNSLLTDLLTSWRGLSSYLPRCGEIVLFHRQADGELEWDRAARRFYFARSAGSEMQPQWEAGVVTQMPMDDLTNDDLVASTRKEKGLNYTGFRIEPLPAPSVGDKHESRRHKYVPLHAIRPFALWRECVDLNQCDSTIQHAVTLASSFCLLQPYRFTGYWPTATLFVRAAFIGHELCQVGDFVRLLPRSGSQVTDVMQITSIRCVFVRLDSANQDDRDGDAHPYNTCIHVAGRALTLDPSRSYGGIAKTPVQPQGLPQGLEGYGSWFPVTDPQNQNLRIEVPFTRVLGRCPEFTALDLWFRKRVSANRLLGFQPVNVPQQQQQSMESSAELSVGLESIVAARAHSAKSDNRINCLTGQSWFWADTRIEQLDLQEVNDHYVGSKDKSRGWRQLELWKRALRAMEGKKEAIEALAKDRGEAKERAEAFRTKGGMLAGPQMMSLDDESSDEDMEEGQQYEDQHDFGIQWQHRREQDVVSEMTSSAAVSAGAVESTAETNTGSVRRMDAEDKPSAQQGVITIDLTSDDETNADDEPARQQVMNRFLKGASEETTAL
ncbi:hypothetical protein K431DRAFT_286557 [Polychaeton citri CBS 116435]|uniref:Cryptic loci regulator 2 N-terminal domain-containing protein n=1 Tax=Polychaeton citri CBS 116435 TaxID=1314669 RepID=A0A9P4UNN7_9PEZI|nr:hypothetical protein K431DRAFT_286557 [Polychaeton citri CBS 116435]